LSKGFHEKGFIEKEAPLIEKASFIMVNVISGLRQKRLF
jgi:hypothetical protein